ncbi:hypothetical protein ACQKE8_23010, partial [Sphingobium limneticum]|uniref:hypothetical protein n=1 Tax=Sphingobium limneticum TaxID=1007511 RepID=UPI003CFD6935
NSTNDPGKRSSTKRLQSASKLVLPPPVEPTTNAGRSDQTSPTPVLTEAGDQPTGSKPTALRPK